MGIAVNQRGSEEIVMDLLHEFQEAISGAVAKVEEPIPGSSPQALWDLCFLLALTDGEAFPKRSSQLRIVVEKLSEEVASHTDRPLADVRSQISTSVARQQQQTQVLFSPLFCTARKTELLGASTVPGLVDGDVRIPLDVVKPSPRFGLLLVGSSSAVAAK